MEIIQVQAGSRRVWLDWSLVALRGMTVLVVVVLEKGSDAVRLMRPAKCWSRLTFPPQGWCDEASAVSVEMKTRKKEENLLYDPHF